MQMLITKITSLLCLLASLYSGLYSGLCLAEPSFNEEFQVNPGISSQIANRVTEYYSTDISLSPAQQQAELAKLDSELQSLESSNSNKASYWFIRGLHNRNMAAYYSSSNQALSKQYISKKNEAYKKSLELSSEPSQLLSASIYNTMKAGLPQDLKILATQAELQQGGSGDSESSYWYLHWSNVDQLQKAGREEEAEKAFKQMQKEMQENKVDMSVYGDLTKQVEKQTFNKNNEPASKPETSAQAEEKSEKSTPISKELIMNTLLILSIVSLILVTFYEFVIRKRKTKRKTN